jgi:hypothetical protein
MWAAALGTWRLALGAFFGSRLAVMEQAGVHDTYDNHLVAGRCSVPGGAWGSGLAPCPLFLVLVSCFLFLILIFKGGSLWGAAPHKFPPIPSS